MIKYYAYYSYGGFKDMLAGGQANPAERTYYLPLVDAGIDTDQTKKDLPKIKILDGDEKDALPGAIVRLASNGGYDIFYSKDLEGKSVLVVRDVKGTEKDDNGRSIPFVVELVGNTSDSALLAKAASYLLNNLGASDKVFGPLFHYDSKANGLCFENKKLSDWLMSIDNGSCTIETVDRGTVNLCSGKTPSFISVKIRSVNDEFLNKLGLTDHDILMERCDRILPDNDQTIKERRLGEWNELQTELRKKKLLFTGLAGGAIAICILVGFLLTKCTESDHTIAYDTCNKCVDARR